MGRSKVAKSYKTLNIAPEPWYRTRSIRFSLQDVECVLALVGITEDEIPGSLRFLRFSSSFHVKDLFVDPRWLSTELVCSGQEVH